MGLEGDKDRKVAVMEEKEEVYGSIILDDNIPDLYVRGGGRGYFGNPKTWSEIDGDELKDGW